MSQFAKSVSLMEAYLLGVFFFGIHYTELQTVNMSTNTNIQNEIEMVPNSRVTKLRGSCWGILHVYPVMAVYMVNQYSSEIVLQVFYLKKYFCKRYVCAGYVAM